MQFVGQYMPWKVSNGEENFAFQVLQF